MRSKALREDRFGAAAPASGLALEPAALLIPCVGFNAQRVRLGYGGGFYDRLLTAARPDALKIGVCFANRLIDDTFPEPHDVPMDEVVSA